MSKRLNAMEFIWPIKVYYEDTDAGGVVFYANYLKFFERARSEWLNSLGVDQADLLAEDIAFAVKSAQVDYLKPARLNDDIEVVTKIVKMTGASLTFEQTIYLTSTSKINTATSGKLASSQNIALCKALIEVVCLKLESFSPCRMPAVVRKELQRVS
jgi:acyl-CoA thioester hydrolase